MSLPLKLTGVGSGEKSFEVSLVMEINSLYSHFFFFFFSTGPPGYRSQHHDEKQPKEPHRCPGRAPPSRQRYPGSPAPSAITSQMHSLHTCQPRRARAPGAQQTVPVPAISSAARPRTSSRPSRHGSWALGAGPGPGPGSGLPGPRAGRGQGRAVAGPGAARDQGACPGSASLGSTG